MKEWGVDGIEAVYTSHTKEETEYFLGLAKELDLLVTGGSDTHYEGDKSGYHAQNPVVGFPAFTPSKELLERLKIIKICFPAIKSRKTKPRTGTRQRPPEKRHKTLGAPSPPRRPR